MRTEITRRQGGVPGEADPAHVQMLVDEGAGENPHSGGTLLSHLLGTRDLLAEWRNPKQLRDAGLFHSIYGTEAYKIQTVPLDRRRDIAAVRRTSPLSRSTR